VQDTQDQQILRKKLKYLFLLEKPRKDVFEKANLKKFVQTQI